MNYELRNAYTAKDALFSMKNGAFEQFGTFFVFTSGNNGFKFIQQLIVRFSMIGVQRYLE